MDPFHCRIWNFPLFTVMTQRKWDHYFFFFSFSVECQYLGVWIWIPYKVDLMTHFLSHSMFTIQHSQVADLKFVFNVKIFLLSKPFMFTPNLMECVLSDSKHTIHLEIIMYENPAMSVKKIRALLWTAVIGFNLLR